jgi:hypothetical protein
MTAPQLDESKESRRALASAFEDVLKADQARREAERRPAAPRRPWLGILSLVVLAAVVTWIAVDRPAWLVPPARVESPGRDDAGLRLTMYAAATRLNAYRAGARRYPPSLAEVPGISALDLRYERTSDTSFVLRGRRGSAALTLNSRDDLDAFLGTSLSRTLQRSGR